jgi:lysophospholipase L1-like esterase
VRTSLIVALIWFLTFAFIGLAGEAYLRWHHFGLPTDERHLPHPYLQNILNPAVEIVPGERLGAHGLRKTGRDHHHDDNQYNIVAIGDSCTFSVASSKEATSYPTLLEERLGEQLDKPVEVYNAGVPGYNSLQMLLKLHMSLRDIKADEVIIYGGWNDLNVMRHDRGSLYIENNANGMPKMYRHRTYWELAQQIPDGLEKIFSRSYLYNHIKFKIVAHTDIKNTVAYWHEHGLESMPPSPVIKPKLIDNFRNNMESIIGLAKGRGAKVAVVTLATPLRAHYSQEYKQQFLEKFGSDTDNFIALTPAEMFYHIKRFNDILRELATAHNIRVYDWEKWYRETDDLSMFTDVVHPNDKGYTYLVEKIVEARNQ